jgi:membrane protein DedA with SNARE-associated domain
MKLLRYIAYSILTCAAVVGGLMVLEVISKQQFERLPHWLQMVLVACVVISCIASVYDFIQGWRWFRRGHRVEDP